MAIFTDMGRDELNRYSLGIIPGFSMTLRLFANPAIPTVASLTTDFTQVDTIYYSPVPLLPTAWVANDSPGLTRYDYPQITWTLPTYSGPAYIIYGFYVTSDLTTVTIFAEAAIVPFPVPLTGGQLCLTVSWTEQNA